MIPVNLVIEDDLSAEIIKVVLERFKNRFWVSQVYPDLKREKASAGYSYIKKKITGFNRAARVTPYIVLVDLDQNECAPTLIKEWLPRGLHPNLIFRVAVREVETWVMADRSGFSRFVGIQSKDIPQNVDQEIRNPKEFLINLARRSNKKEIKYNILPKHGSSAKVGTGYNDTLIHFLHHHWRVEEAIKYSDSLKRLFHLLENFQPTK